MDPSLLITPILAAGLSPDLLPRLLLAGGLAALFAVVVGTLLANRITRPIQQMTHASEAMAKGDYSQRVEVRPEDNDEVANLGRAFNQMAQQVDRSTRAMRQLHSKSAVRESRGA